MKATALITWEDQSFSLEDVELAGPGPDQISIKTEYTGVSIGTEFALIRNKISWGPYPICTGYMGTGFVEEVGKNITNFTSGDRVYYRQNDAMQLGDGRPVSCASGAHASRVVLNPNTSHGAYHLRSEADMETASMYVMPAVGLFGVDMANPRMGQSVAVYGCGLIGLGVIAACVQRGCIVIAIDLKEKQLKIAKALGANHLIDASTVDVSEKIAELTGEGADVVFESTGIPSCVDEAIPLCRPYGSFVWQGNYGSAPLSWSFLPAHGRRLKMFFPCDDGLEPCREAVIRNMALGILPWDRCITNHADFQDAPEIYGKINGGDPDITGVTFCWKGA